MEETTPHNSGNYSFALPNNYFYYCLSIGRDNELSKGNKILEHQTTDQTMKQLKNDVQLLHHRQLWLN